MEQREMLTVLNHRQKARNLDEQLARDWQGAVELKQKQQQEGAVRDEKQQAVIVISAIALFEAH